MKDACVKKYHPRWRLDKPLDKPKVHARKLHVAFIVLTMLSGANIAHAGTAAMLKQGETIYQHGVHATASCASCHGKQAQGMLGPRLAGLGQAYIVRQLQSFASGIRKNRLMTPVAKAMGRDAMQAVAGWLASQQPRHSSSRNRHLQPAMQTLITAGLWSRNIPACVDCHASNLMGDHDTIPALAGQSSSYLAKRLDWFRTLKTPSNTPVQIMSHVAARLSSDEIAELAKALAALEGKSVQWSQPLADSVQTSPKPNGAEKRNREKKRNREEKQNSGQNAGFSPPDESALPASPQLAAAIRRGERIFTDTAAFAKAYVGKANHLSCVHCHLNRGRLATAAPMWAAAVRYPIYRSKNHRINTLAMRIQGCFRYSLNGSPPPATSEVMVDLLAYIHWLATGLAAGIRPPAHGFPAITKPARAFDLHRGRILFGQRCAMCHGMNGQGKIRVGKTLFPPLWGAHAFNWGAGMHRVDKAAAFIKANMPYGDGGSLNLQDAWDIAAFVDAHPRPEDPRFTGNIAETIARFHKHRDVDFYAMTHTHEP